LVVDHTVWCKIKITFFGQIFLIDWERVEAGKGGIQAIPLTWRDQRVRWMFRARANLLALFVGGGDEVRGAALRLLDRVAADPRSAGRPLPERRGGGGGGREGRGLVVSPVTHGAREADPESAVCMYIGMRKKRAKTKRPQS